MSSRGGGFCCVQNIATDDEGEDLASAVTATAAVRSQASSTKMARFHELKRQASASTSSQTSSPELRKREASPPLCTVTLRGRTVVKKSSPDSKVSRAASVVLAGGPVPLTIGPSRQRPCLPSNKTTS